MADPKDTSKPAGQLPQPGVDLTAAPDWWLTRPQEIRDFLESLDGVVVEEIGKTAGGRPIIAAGWGARENLPGRTSQSLCSALSTGIPSAFYGKGRRQRQSILFIGAAHGTEFDGTVAALNCLNIVVTGKDLVGRAQPKMAENMRRFRWAVIPILNVDGRERAADVRHWIGCNDQYFFMRSQGLWADGKIADWAPSKATWPMVLDQVKVLGTYYNDAGYNLVYDFPCPECQSETAALMRFCRREMPDVAILSHSNAGSLVFGPAATIPSNYKQRVNVIGGAVVMRCLHDGFTKGGLPQTPYTAGSLDGSGSFYQSDLVYQTCGALPLVIEFPAGWQGYPDNHLALLDIGLGVLDELCAFGARYQFRPYEKNEV
jgi:hypothetical protein